MKPARRMSDRAERLGAPVPSGAKGVPSGKTRPKEPETTVEVEETRSPFAVIESVLSPSGEPVLGLHLHVAHKQLLQSFARNLGKREITPNSVGVLALVECYPGISQISLAKLLRLERASAGDRVARCISAGMIRRVDSPDDKRRYALFLTPSGRRILERLRKQIPQHEEAFAAQLTVDERRTLISLLDKLVPSWAGLDLE